MITEATPGRQPSERNLRGRDAVPGRDLDECVDDAVELVLVADGRLVPLGELARSGRRRLIAAVLAGEQAAGQRAPDEDPDALVDRGRDQLVLRVRDCSE
jgi:hypothetical protein